MRHQLLSCVLLIMVTNVAQACNIPVFRYALERWKPDPIEIVVFAEKGDSKHPFVKQLAKGSVEQDGANNTKVSIEDPTKPANRQLWSQLVAAHVQSHGGGDSDQSAKPALPHLVASTEIKGKRVNNWSGNLDAAQAHLLQSPARKELKSRLLGGDSIVWLLIKSKDKAKSKAARELLAAECKKLEKSLKLPEGIGLPGSELFADVPLLLQFSVLEIDAADPKEAYLVELFSGFHPEALEKGEPLAAPVFGRGRALEVVPGKELSEQLIVELTQFLCGACSCKVKGLNPGFDLLVEADWDNELFGPDGERPGNASEDSTPLPTLITIPPGRSERK